MKKLTFANLLVCSLLAAGCADTASTGGGGLGQAETGETSGETSGAPVATKMPQSVKTKTVLSPANAKIVFVGTHVGEPNPRTGGFERFSGQLEFNEETNALETVKVEIETESIWTQIERLTNHLKSADFFEVNAYPTAKFESTRVTPMGDGQYNVTGDLTLLETTKEITFPVTMSTESMAGDDVRLNGEFTVMRKDFGINYDFDRVENEVSLQVVVGEPTQPLPSEGSGGGGGRGGGGGFNPAAMFERQDADGDGKLSGDEIPGMMRENLASFDTDGDGAISMEEMLERMRQFRGGGGGGDRPGRPDGANPASPEGANSGSPNN